MLSSPEDGMMTAEGFASALNFIVKALQKGNGACGARRFPRGKLTGWVEGFSLHRFLPGVAILMGIVESSGW